MADGYWELSAVLLHWPGSDQPRREEVWGRGKGTPAGQVWTKRPTSAGHPVGMTFTCPINVSQTELVFFLRVGSCPVFPASVDGVTSPSLAFRWTLYVPSTRPLHAHLSRLLNPPAQAFRLHPFPSLRTAWPLSLSIRPSAVQ